MPNDTFVSRAAGSQESRPGSGWDRAPGMIPHALLPHCPVPMPLVCADTEPAFGAHNTRRWASPFWAPGPIGVARSGFLCTSLDGRGGVVYIRQGSRARSWPGSFVFLYIYPAPLGVVVGHAAWRRLEGLSAPLRRRSMQDRGSELRRIHLPRTPVNKVYRGKAEPIYRGKAEPN